MTAVARAACGPLLVALAVVAPLAVARADDSPLVPPPAPVESEAHDPHWRWRFEAGAELGGTGAPESATAVVVGRVFSRVGARVWRGFSVAATIGIDAEHAVLESIGNISGFEDVGLEFRLSQAARSWWRPLPKRTEVYLSVPVGVSFLRLDGRPHRAFTVATEQRTGHYVGIGGGVVFFLGRIGLFGELSYVLHPFSFTATINPVDGSPPVDERIDSPGTRIMVTAGCILAL